MNKSTRYLQTQLAAKQVNGLSLAVFFVFVIAATAVALALE